MGGTLSITARADVDELPDVVGRLEAFFEAHEVPPAAANHVLLALDELVANVAAHAYPADAADPFLRLDVSVEDGAVDLTVADGGLAFDPLNAAAPDVTLPVEERPIGGLGIFLVQKLMDSVAYDRVEGQNRVRIVKRFA